MAVVRKIRFVIQLYLTMKLHLPKLFVDGVAGCGFNHSGIDQMLIQAGARYPYYIRAY